MAETDVTYGGPLVSRKAAQEQNAKLYFTGRPCGRGHISQRRTSTGACVSCHRENATAWGRAHPELVKARRALWYETNAEKAKRKAREWLQANKQRARASSKEWHLRNPKAQRAYKANRAARKRDNGRHYPADVAKILIRQKSKCAGCGVDVSRGYHVDHIHPLALGGSNDRRNLQILCVSCNLRKSRKHPIVWAQENGRLL